MRVCLELMPKETLVLPIHYNPVMQGVVYRTLADREFSTRLHDEGAHKVGAKPVKLFTFSRLQGSYQINREKKTIAFTGPLRWVVSSAVDDLVYDLAMSLLKSRRISLHGSEVSVHGANLETYAGTTTQTQIELLSPVTVYRTVNRPNGRKYTEYYRPGTQEFADLLRQNMVLKAAALGEDVPEDATIELMPIDQRGMQERVVLFRDTPIHAWDGNFRLSGAKRMLEIAWNAGIGGKNSAGFGLFDVFSQGR